MSLCRILIGDCLERMRELPDNSVDSVVCDPPYHLIAGGLNLRTMTKNGDGSDRTKQENFKKGGFMGLSWDGGDVAFRPETWAEVLRVLKPGGHLLAFSGTRTYHRMAVAIEDAGFEIRDCISWVYASGFPKSLSVSKAIDKSVGAEREIVGPSPYATRANKTGRAVEPGGQGKRTHTDDRLLTSAATDDAKRWEGWGTALKPSHEPLCLAQKPYENDPQWVTVLAHIQSIWSALWSMLPASDAEQSSWLNPAAYGVAPRAFAQWPAELLSNTRAALFDQMDTSRLGSVLTSSLSTVFSWSSILSDAYRAESTSTTETVLSTTIDWTTLKSCLSKITPESIIQAHSQGLWRRADACNAARYLNALLGVCAATLELSALGNATDLDAPVSPVEGAQTEQICLARKPLSEKSVAANVLRWGCGALNIDATRIPSGQDHADKCASVVGLQSNRNGACYGEWTGERQDSHSPLGRWPANLVHDGSDEVVAGFPETGPSVVRKPSGKDDRGVPGFVMRRQDTMERGIDDEGGSAARFFYCAKTSSEERGEGNTHPTVKPVALMRWLVRLVTPKGGTVLDPFMGSGSTALACQDEQFSFIGCELSQEYASIAEGRMLDNAGLFAEVEVIHPQAKEEAA